MVESDIPKIDGDVLFASEINSLARKFATGTITLQTTTTAYDTNFADIDFAAGDLTANDFVIIKVAGENKDAGVNMSIQAKMVNTSNDGQAFKETTLGASTGFFIDWELAQSPNTNDVIIGGVRTNEPSGQTREVESGTYDTNDANIFTTAWTFRINMKYASSATTSSIVRYFAYILKAGT